MKKLLVLSALFLISNKMVGVSFKIESLKTTPFITVGDIGNGVLLATHLDTTKNNVNIQQNIQQPCFVTDLHNQQLKNRLAKAINSQITGDYVVFCKPDKIFADVRAEPPSKVIKSNFIGSAVFINCQWNGCTETKLHFYDNSVKGQ